MATSDKSREAQEHYAPVTHVTTKGIDAGDTSPTNGAAEHGTPELTATGFHAGADAAIRDDNGARRGFWDRDWFGYVKTKEFWVVLVLGQVLSITLTGQNTLSSLL
ncbi:MAG: hypothetical protein M1820_004620, partial [Bogoriella megaspora]